MLKNYFRVAYRNLIKNKVSSFVNIFGLSVAVGCAITVFLFIERNYTMDWFHENGENIFLVESYIQRGDRQQLYGDAPMPIGPAMVADLPLVKRAVRVAYGGATFRAEEQTFREGFYYVDPEFLDVFSFKLATGDQTSFSRRNSIVLSDRLATKYFGEEDPIGRDITLLHNDDITKVYTVTGVAEPFPTKASFSFRALIHYDNLDLFEIDQQDWSRFTEATFIEVGSPDDIDTIAGQMDGYRDIQNAANEDRKITAFEFGALHGMASRSRGVTNDIGGGEDPVAILVLGLVAIFLLTLSCINYMNLAVATASRRLKEIGIRKVVGGSRGQLVRQFLSENVLLCVFTLGLGVLIARFLFVPGFNNLFDFGGDGFTISGAETGLLWVFLTALLLITGLVSGAYPALYISSFRPSAIFRGQQQLGGENFFTRGFLTFQFVLAFLTMIMGVVLAQNSDYQANRDWGYQKENLLVLRTLDASQYTMLRNAVMQLPDVEVVVGSANHFGRSWSRPDIDIAGEKMSAVKMNIGFGYLRTYGVPLLSGRFFDENLISDTNDKVIINDQFVQARGWTPQSALGQSFRQDTLSYTVIGVTADFMYDDFYDPIEPVFMGAVTDSQFRFLSMRVRPGSGDEVDEAVQEIWRNLLPQQQYAGFFQDIIFENVYRENISIKQLFSFIAGLALMIACMGLYGLASQTVARRMREVSIRKVLGASIPHVTQIVNRSFLVIIVIAAVIATPLGYYAMDALLNEVWSDPVTMGPFPFVLSFGLVMLTAVLTIATQVHKFVYANPAEVLRNE